MSNEKYLELDKVIDAENCSSEALIKVLHSAQKIFTYLPKDVILHVSRRLNLPAAEVYGVVSFYSYFNLNPVGKYVISVCMGTACFVRGADKIIEGFEEKLNIKRGQTTEDMLYTIKDVRCIGACGLAPVLLVNEDVYGNKDETIVDEILNKYSGE